MSNTAAPTHAHVSISVGAEVGGSVMLAVVASGVAVVLGLASL